MSKTFDGSSNGKLGKAKSWADVGDDDFFAAVAQDKKSPTANWGARTETATEKKSAGGVPWAFPNPVQSVGAQQQQSSPASQSGGGDRFGCFSPNSRTTQRSAPMSAWRK